MIVFTIEQLAIAHIRQCCKHLEESKSNKLRLLYAASTAHLALHTVLMISAYSESDTSVLDKRSRKRVEADPHIVHEGVRVKVFSLLLEDFLAEDGKNHSDLKAKMRAVRETITDLSSIRNQLEHPVPGVNGFTQRLIVDSIEIVALLIADFLSDLSLDNASIKNCADDSKETIEAIVRLCRSIRKDIGPEVI